MNKFKIEKVDVAFKKDRPKYVTAFYYPAQDKVVLYQQILKPIKKNYTSKVVGLWKIKILK